MKFSSVSTFYQVRFRLESWCRGMRQQMQFLTPRGNRAAVKRRYMASGYRDNEVVESICIATISEKIFLIFKVSLVRYLLIPDLELLIVLTYHKTRFLFNKQKMSLSLSITYIPHFLISNPLVHVIKDYRKIINFIFEWIIMNIDFSNIIKIYIHTKIIYIHTKIYILLNIAKHSSNDSLR